MDIQLIAVIAIGAAALFYISRRIYRQMSGKSHPGCEKCEASGKH